MDIYCPRCAEPWGIDSLHDAVEEGSAPDFAEARHIFAANGCGTLFNGRPCKQSDDPRAHLAAELFDILGDDIDGIASMHADAEFIGWN